VQECKPWAASWIEGCPRNSRDSVQMAVRVAVPHIVSPELETSQMRFIVLAPSFCGETPASAASGAASYCQLLTLDQIFAAN
jgi:hypothetical protein